MVLPPPAPGLVVHFSYLWRNQFEQGEETGRKVRPCLIIAVGTGGGELRAYIVPITHREPPQGRGVPIPPKVKMHLGLDDQASWIIIDDLNVTIWPGFDLHPIHNRSGSFVYGEIPASLLRQVLTAIKALQPPPKATPRT